MAGGAAAAGGASQFAQSLADFGMQQVAKGINAREAQKARKHQLFMRATQYQTAASDLEKAGLNRILALGGPARSGGAPQAGGATGGRGGKGDNLYLAELDAELKRSQTSAQVASANQANENAEATRLQNVDAANFNQWMADNPEQRRAGYAYKHTGLVGAGISTARDIINEENLAPIKSAYDKGKKWFLRGSKPDFKGTKGPDKTHLRQK